MALHLMTNLQTESVRNSNSNQINIAKKVPISVNCRHFQNSPFCYSQFELCVL